MRGEVGSGGGADRLTTSQALSRSFNVGLAPVTNPASDQTWTNKILSERPDLFAYLEKKWNFPSPRNYFQSP